MMRKWAIPVLLFIIPYSLGLWVKQQLFVSPSNFLSERNLNFCLQNILWWPTGLMGAGWLALFPEHFTKFFSGNRESTIMELLQVRVMFGLVFLMTFYVTFVDEGTRNFCFTAVALAK